MGNPSVRSGESFLAEADKNIDGVSANSKSSRLRIAPERHA
jgi:hypothetical protein